MSVIDRMRAEARAEFQSRRDREQMAEDLVKPENLPEFAEKLLGLTLTHNQRLWHEHMRENRMILMEAAVGHGKSTWLYPEVVQWICRCQLHDEWHPVLFGTSRTPLARDYTNRIQRALRLPMVIELYGAFYDREQYWATDGFRVLNQPTHIKEPMWRAAGINSAIEGTRADWGILDDPVDLDNALSPADRDRAWWWFTSTFTARLNQGARVTVIGSSWHPEDLYSKIRDGGEYSCYKYPAYGEYDWGELLSPELWSDEALQSKKREIGTTMFELRYMMNHMAMMGGFFDEKWITYLETLPEGIKPAQGWDFAISKSEIADPKRADPDYTAGVTVGFDPYDGCLVLLDVFRERVTQDHHHHIKQAWRKWGSNQVGLETNAFQKLIKYRLQEEAPEVPAVAVEHYHTDKKTRLLALQPYFERGLKVYRGMDRDSLMAFLNEYRTFPHGDHDDILDAMEIAVGMLKKGHAILLEGFDDW